MKSTALICAVLLTGCSQSEDRQLIQKCKDLIDRELVSPSSAKYLASKVFRRVQTDYRLPEGMPDMDQFQSDLDSLKFDIKSAEILNDAGKMQRLQGELAELKKQSELATKLLEEAKKKPWAEIFWELDSPNRSGATIRLAGVCTFQDDGNVQTRDSTFQLSSLGEGRIPQTSPTPFDASARP